MFSPARGLAVLAGLGIALALAACDKPEEGTEECQEIYLAVELGAKCAAYKAGIAKPEATDEEPAFDQEACPKYDKTFRALGLTTHDAGKILNTSLDAFFETYKGESFCAYLKDKMDYLDLK